MHILMYVRTLYQAWYVHTMEIEFNFFFPESGLLEECHLQCHAKALDR